MIDVLQLPEDTATEAFTRAARYQLPDGTPLLMPEVAWSLAQEIGLNFLSGENPIDEDGNFRLQYRGVESDIALTLYLASLEESDLRAAVRNPGDVKFDALEWLNAFGYSRNSEEWRALIKTATEIWSDIFRTTAQPVGDIEAAGNGDGGK